MMTIPVADSWHADAPLLHAFHELVGREILRGGRQRKKSSWIR